MQVVAVGSVMQFFSVVTSVVVVVHVVWSHFAARVVGRVAVPP